MGCHWCVLLLCTAYCVYCYSTTTAYCSCAPRLRRRWLSRRRRWQCARRRFRSLGRRHSTYQPRDGVLAHDRGRERVREGWGSSPVVPRRCRRASHPPSAARGCIRSPGERYSAGIEVICPMPCIPPAADEKCTGEIGAKLPYLLLRICLACRSCL